MTIRSVIISFFVLAFSFGMVLMNQVNMQWAVDNNNLTFIGGERTPYLNYTDVNLPTTRIGYNSTMGNLMDYNKPNDAILQLDIFQNIKYGQILFDLLFNIVFGFPQFLANAFGMSQLLVLPLTAFIVINHILAVIYIVTGRTFIY